MFLEAPYVAIGVRESSRLYWPTSLATHWRTLFSVSHWCTWRFTLVRQTNTRTAILLESLGVLVCPAPFPCFMSSSCLLPPPPPPPPPACVLSHHLSVRSSSLLASHCNLMSLRSYVWVLLALWAIFSNPTVSPWQCPRSGIDVELFLSGLLSCSPHKMGKVGGEVPEGFPSSSSFTH